MKNKLRKTIGRLFIAALFAAVLTATGFAQPEADLQVVQTTGIEPLSRQFRSVDTGFAVKNNAASKTPFLSKSSQTNFSLGSDFVIALADAANWSAAKTDGASALIADLVYLIDRLEAHPEADTLQKTVRSVVRRTIDAPQVRLEIENAHKSYAARLRSDQKWYFESGSTLTNLVFSAYLSDAAATKKNLSEIQNLIKIAPQETSTEIITPMITLAKYIARTAFAEKDYVAIFEGAINLVDTINT